MVHSEVDLLMLCNLESILTGSDWEKVFEDFYTDPVQDAGPDGPLIYKVSEKLLQVLPALNSEALLSCADKWSETDEWTLRQEVPEEIVNVLHSLSGLAKHAVAEGKKLYLLTTA